jgi:hypothetical protein
LITGSFYEFESVLFESPRISRPIELKLKGVTLEVNLFESISKPYLTGTISINDDRDLLRRADILGGETITFKIKSAKEGAKSFSIRFYVSAIASTIKTDNHRIVYNLHLKEDIDYEANLQNINRSYNGKCSKIIEKILKNYLNRELITTKNDTQSVKVIVPNMNPLEAAQWLANRASTINGYPFYLYSTIFDNDIRLIDLGTMLESPSINPKTPFVYFSGQAQAQSEAVDRRTIFEVESSVTQDLYSLIKRGAIGASYEYINTFGDNKNEFDFDVVDQLLKPLIEKSILQKNQNNPLYSPSYTYNEKPFNKYQSKHIARIGGNKAFDSLLSYEETSSVGDYKLSVISDAMHKILQKAPLQVTVNGYDLIDGDKATTIGNTVTLHFNKANADITSAPSIDDIDTKMSGDYLIFGAKHMFRGDRFYTKLDCVKLANYREVR